MLSDQSFLAFSEFESYMQWWSQDTSHNGEIHTYTLTNEQSEAAAASPKTRVPHDDVWVFWDDKWFSWKTANIKLRFLRNLGTALPQVRRITVALVRFFSTCMQCICILF